jgi:hypothetical protein
VVGLAELEIAPRRNRLVEQKSRVDLAIDADPQWGVLSKVMRLARPPFSRFGNFKPFQYLNPRHLVNHLASGLE